MEAATLHKLVKLDKTNLLQLAINEERITKSDADLLNDLIQGNKLTYDEKVNLDLYLSRKYGNHSCDKILGLEKDYGQKAMCYYMTIGNISRRLQIYAHKILNNPSYMAYEMFEDTLQLEVVEDVLTKEYYEIVKKSNPDKEMITISHRHYSNGLKEGVLIKRSSYQVAYTINVYGISGNFTYDVGEQKAYGGKQQGMLLRFTELPIDKDDMLNSFYSYQYLEKYTQGTKVYNDFSNDLVAYPSASKYWNKNTINVLQVRFLIYQYKKHKKQKTQQKFVKTFENILNN